MVVKWDGFGKSVKKKLENAMKKKYN